eukprot:CAMPEP_0114418190 /NCGR_PEP_ID=MMETSP0103-20121206/3363_1 /TAXON_ID=37642 ORGANISM="Paraphysomonas imperforata, Strain PA2" /NCGR_SAMPLE_ID=MMETSP0103 /ASSEMBLY_ACC=CAM_ASM_000201 /LENGTH=1047 /DNA_ID=CAMNT_0001586529 /DNA_START=158 /DNA_END=3298 /DNA_ORIENTATION=-
MWNFWRSEEVEEVNVPDLTELHIGPEERQRGDQMHPTPAHSAFRHQSVENMSRHGLQSSSDDDSDDDTPIGLVRTPPPKNSFNVENTPPSTNGTSARKLGRSSSSSSKINGRDDEVDSVTMDIDIHSPSAAAGYASCYIPPSCDLMMRHARATFLTRPDWPSGSASSTPKKACSGGEGLSSPPWTGDQTRGLGDKQRLLATEKEQRYQKELTALRNEQRMRQASQQKEFEDGHQFSLRCEEFQLQVVAMGGQLGLHSTDLDRLRRDIEDLRAKMDGVYYVHLGENIKSSLNEQIEAAEASLAKSEGAIERVRAFIELHKDKWLDEEELKTLLDSDDIKGLRSGRNNQVLLFDRVVETLKGMQALSPRECLDQESVAFLQKNKIANCTSFLECCQRPEFSHIVSLDLSLGVHSLKDILAKIAPTLSSDSFGRLKGAVHQKVALIEEQIEFIDNIIAEISNGTAIDDVSFTLQESLESETARRARAQGSSDIRLLDNVLQGLEQIRAKKPVEEIDPAVINFLTDKNESFVRLAKRLDSGQAPAGGVAESVSVDFLGPNLNDLSASVDAVIKEAPSEHRERYEECLRKCQSLSAELQKLATAEKERSAEGVDKRNERRTMICQTTLFLEKKLGEISGATKKHLLSHIFQLVTSMTVTQNLVTILELSIIPSTLCLGNIERAKIFHDVVKAGAPMCSPRLDITSKYFDRRQRVRLVGLYACQVTYSIDLNEMIGMSGPGLEKTLQTLWHWLVSCGNALSFTAKGGGDNSQEAFSEICDSIKLFLDIAGATLLNFLGPRFLQFLVGPMKQVVQSRPETEAKRLLELLNEANANKLASRADLYFLEPMSCFARVKKCEWENTSEEWKIITVTMKKELTDVKKIVGRAFNQLGTDADGLRTFQESMGRLKGVSAMQNPDLRKKVLFFLSDKALSTCRDFKRDATGNNPATVVAPLAKAFLWLLGSQKGMADIFFSGLCSYCPFAYQMSMAVSEDDAVNKLELGYQASSASQDSKKWRSQMEMLLSFYATLLVHGHERAAQGGSALSHFTASDAW